MKLIIKLILSVIFIMFFANILDFVKIDDWVTATFVVIVLAILNVVLKPLLILLTIPITVFTLGLFLLFINAIILWVADGLIAGFDVQGFWGTVLFSIILSLSNSIIDRLVGDDKRTNA